MRKIYLLSLLIVLSINEITAQNVDYSTPLYTNTTFSKVIDTSLPVGSIQGSGDVSSGAATYSIPISLPPGTNNVVPGLSLEYNSAGANGLLAAGWNISGLSNISRSGQTIYHDGKVTPVNLGTGDRFLLDGERLIAVTGTYGASGTAYGAESENFAVVTSNGVTGAGPTWFKVINKDGSEMEYGNTTDSRILDASGTHVLYWRLNKLKHADGNYITLKYLFDDRDSRIDEINYTGNDATGLTPYNKVKFTYKIRADITTQYIFGSPLLSKYLLDKITVTAETQNVKSYEFRYGWDNINSYLRELVETGANGTTKLNSTIFKYGQPPEDFQNASLGNDETEGNDYYTGDFNGDGKTDILTAVSVNSGIPYYNYHTKFRTHLSQPGTSVLVPGISQPLPPNYSMIRKEEIPNDYNILASDFTGDGLDDVVTLKITNTGSFSRLDSVIIYESINGGTEFTKHRRSVQPNFFKIDPNGNYFFPGDFDGDGISEYITILGNTLDNYDAFLCTNYLTGGACGSISTSGTVNIPSSQWATANKIYVLDFDGDGKSELMVVKEFNTEIFTFDGYTARSIYYSGFPTKNHLIYFGDFNADRKTDMLVRNSLNNNSAAWTKAVSIGNNFIETPFTFAQTPDISNEFYKNHHLNLGDFNGDGKTDIYHGKNVFSGPSFVVANLDVYYSRGDDFYHIRTDLAQSLSGSPSQISDLNGDGRAEVLSKKFYSDPYNVFNFKPGGKEHLLERVANGHGHITTWFYGRLADGGSFYTKGGASAYPFNSIQPPIYTVSHYIQQNGISAGENRVLYNYENARFHRAGKGFLGFGKVTASNLATGIKTVSENEFNTTYFAIAPKKTATYLTAGNVLLTETTQVNEFIAQGPVSDKRFLYRLKSSSENNLFEGRTVGSVNDSFDAYGNVTQNTATNNVGTVVTATLYGAHPGSIPNKPTSVTVTKTRSGQPAFAVTNVMIYNAIGQLEFKTDFNGLAKKVVTGYEYFPLGNLKKTTVTPYGAGAPVARSTSIVYDTKGRYPESSTNELGQVSSATYDPKWGKPLTSTGVDGLVTSNQYDVFGRTTITAPPAATVYNVTQTYGWDQTNGAVWYSLVSHPGKPDVKTWHDKLNRVIKTETEGFGGQWIIQTQAYDANGNVISSTQPYKSGETVITTTTQYDIYNRPYNINSGVLGTTTIGYSYGSGNLTVTTNAPAGTSSQTTDAGGQVTSVTDNGGSLNYTWYSHGGLKDVKNGGTTLTSNEYDEYGRQTQLIDANAGTTQYVNNALGELVSQTNANGQTHTMLYDVLGRNYNRSGPEGTTISEFYPSGSGAATNQIKKITGFSGNVTDHVYDDFGRIQTLTQTVDGTAHTETYSYNNYNDLVTTSYPSGFGTNHAYDGNGYPTTIKNNTNTVTLYNTTAINGEGQVTSYTLGNGQSAITTYTNGFPTRYLTSGRQDLNLDWNYQTGNLNSRNDAIKVKTESFTYDNLNRLKTTAIGAATLTVNYAANGNISDKPDAGSYSYHATKLNAVTGVTNSSSAIPLLQQDISYTAFMQPDIITENGYEISYTYGADYERIKGVTKQGGSTINTRYYFTGYEKDISGSVTKYIQYISSPAGLIAIVESNGGTHTPHYTYTDHLGSILTITNSSGTVEADQSFDAWGRRRDPVTWALLLPTATTSLPNWLYRGFTAHEHLDQFGLINMNGRMYDPVVGRMLSPDNNIQEPGMTQSFNRYSYAMNNPLVYTDPDGEFWHIVIGAAVGGVVNLGIKAFQGKIHNFKDGAVAFGIGAAAGAVTAATGGASAVYATTGSFAGALSSTAVASASTGISGGLITGAAGSATGGLIQGVGNAAYFGDSYSFKEWATGVVFGGLTGGIAGGIAAKLQNANVWNGLKDGSRGWFPNFGQKAWVKTGSGWKLAGGGGFGGNGTGQFPDYIDDLGTTHTGGRFAVNSPYEIGVAGENAVGITGGKIPIQINGRTRIPDRLTKDFLEEVKNVKHQSYTRQLRDFYDFSQQKNLKMILHTRPNTTFSGPLQKMINDGLIIRKNIPGL